MEWAVGGGGEVARGTGEAVSHLAETNKRGSNQMGEKRSEELRGWK